MGTLVGDIRMTLAIPKAGDQSTILISTARKPHGTHLIYVLVCKRILHSSLMREASKFLARTVPNRLRRPQRIPLLFADQSAH